MSEQVHVVSAVYSNDDQANTVLDTLEKMHRAGNITLKDAALISRLADGKIEIKETKEVTTRKGAKRGAIIAGVFGVIYPPSLIASVLVGGGIGAIWGKLRDTGIKNASLKDVADGLQPGQVAVVALTDEPSEVSVEQALHGFDAEPVRSQLSAEESAAVEQAAAE